ncbi:MAG: hypothetical protein PQJ28_00015 [Spirochaetales bacterium]|nr:hypothetical protein [Spirochaetales bacterium]
MNIVMIHGRDQQNEDPSDLKKEWIETLEKGLELSNLELPEDTNIVFPFFGDLLDELGKDLYTEIQGVIAKGEEEKKLVSFQFDLVSELASNAMITDEQIKVYSDRYQEKGPLNWAWVQAAMRALDQYTGFGDFSIRQFTRDVYLYLNIPPIRKKIDSFIASSIPQGETMIIGHSLGSVIGYNVLSQLEDFEIVKYITVGSPLGLKSIKNKLETPLRMPKVIRSGWYNAYDEKDYIALNPLDDKHFPISPTITNSNHVSNHTRNHHGIKGYLDDKTLAQAIYDIINKS